MFKFLIMSFYYYMKGKCSIFIREFISILRIVWIVWRLFIKANMIFDLHAFLLNAHGA